MCIDLLIILVRSKQNIKRGRVLTTHKTHIKKNFRVHYFNCKYFLQKLLNKGSIGLRRRGKNRRREGWGRVIGSGVVAILKISSKIVWVSRKSVNSGIVTCIVRFYLTHQQHEYTRTWLNHETTRGVENMKIVGEEMMRIVCRDEKWEEFIEEMEENTLNSSNH